MKNIFIILALPLFISACGSTGTTTAIAPLMTTNVTIDVFKTPGNPTNPICVDRTKSKVKSPKCKKQQDNKICVKIGDTVTWSWNSTSIDRPFEIVSKTGFTSPFVTPDANCTDPANTVTCTIAGTATKNSFYEYDVVVSSTDPSCNLDPRILIY